MNKIKNTFLLSFMALFSVLPSFSQYSVNGSAVQNGCKCFTLTEPLAGQAGSVWALDPIDLNSSFDFSFKVFLGCSDSPGADGIVFGLQQEGPNALGYDGSLLGFFPIRNPNYSIEIDTWGLPGYDHIAIHKNGLNIDHTDPMNVIAGPVSANGGNIEDCQWHSFRVKWDAPGKRLEVYFDGSLRIGIQYDLVGNLYSLSPMMYWGFTGATGGEFNLQQFCIESVSDVTANFISDAINNTVCEGTPITFIDSSWNTGNIQNYFWDFGDGSTSSLQNPPPHVYATSGTYVVKHLIKGTNGCVSDTISETFYVKKATAFAGNDTVAVKGVPLQLFGIGGVIYSWSPPTGLNNPFIQNPIALLENNIQHMLTVTTTEGCIGTDEISIKVFKEIAIYVPTGFTPNHDALNDLLKPAFIGFRKLSYFRVFNRWGQLVFSSNNMSKGWDGYLNGIKQQTGVYIWMIKAEDITGKIHELKGTSTLIR